ncbi:MAG TPA: RNA polymerase sigma factor, partial [Planctomycetes bacterium]|nr:RNA polymerase sigma factor [Planctomycetota bacterium]
MAEAAQGFIRAPPHYNVRMAVQLDRQARLKLAELALSGDKPARDRLLDDLRPRLFRFIMRHVGDHDLAEEITQESLVRIFEKFDAVRAPAAFDGWAFQVASNILRDHFRRARRDEHLRGKLQLLEWGEA